jgi:hypothetical protein
MCRSWWIILSLNLIRFALDSFVLLERALILSSGCFFSAHLMAAHCSHVIFHRHRSELLARGFTFRVGGGFIHQFARDRFTSFVLISCLLLENIHTSPFLFFAIWFRVACGGFSCAWLLGLFNGYCLLHIVLDLQGWIFLCGLLDEVCAINFYTFYFV